MSGLEQRYQAANDYIQALEEARQSTTLHIEALIALVEAQRRYITILEDIVKLEIENGGG